ncbi:sigma-54-dependent transcriptional regulator [Solitalea koreensis]|uniref:DNA-binding transcriptional response regulator, NtrC family, contains REC, AAA-type ATPase, and a Fis-type DNA-binding domains n=1 Tax=Solitalea koreensis TaxID=543615 RepID=A0A521C4J5_9SPHI|nr:sigma-54 dependent transcriptional regulator [Solitalea koreensis]SMO54313.1 DNA-binding transcriptional response regulator, NtrC family, contains REC, AAA-type ATPase, and a Fis-type DNA-binding domains [Solitalea koreensis]
MSKGNILIIDDEDKLRGLLARILSLEGYSLFEAATGKEGLKKLELEDIQVVLSDVKLPDANGVELTQSIRSKYPELEIIVLTAFGTIADGVKAIKNGAFDYITKGDDNDKIIPLVAKAMEKAQMQQRLHHLEKRVGEKYSFDKIIGQSKQIQDAITLARKVSNTDTTVLLLGETGTGKEVFAEAIHQESSRQKKNFVAVNCSAFSKELLESELFGHKAGAFTGATKDTKGLFEEANEGTIFLDEIGEMNIDLQAKLLRVLETGELLKVGESKTSKVNVRVIAATNRDLKTESENGHFRLDLFYRLSVFQINLPALRDRKKDILELANFFLKQFGAKTNKRIIAMSPEFLTHLQNYNWRGNIRELKNIMERAVILCDSNSLTVEDLPFELQQDAISGSITSSFDLSTVEKQHIKKVLAHTGGNKTEAARLLNIGLTTLYRKIEEYKI